MMNLPVMLECHHRDGLITRAVVRDFEPSDRFMVPADPKTPDAEPRSYRLGAQAKQFVHVWSREKARPDVREAREELCLVARYWEEAGT